MFAINFINGVPNIPNINDKIENIALPEDIEQGENDFSFNICVRRLLDNGTDVYECFKSLMASFILDEETGVTVKEPVILIDKL